MSALRNLSERTLVRPLGDAEIEQVFGGETDGGCFDPDPSPPTLQEMIDAIMNPGSLEDRVLGR